MGRQETAGPGGARAQAQPRAAGPGRAQDRGMPVIATVTRGVVDLVVPSTQPLPVQFYITWDGAANVHIRIGQIPPPPPAFPGAEGAQEGPTDSFLGRCGTSYFKKP